MPDEGKNPYNLVPAGSLKIIDLSQPHTDTLNFKIKKEIGNKSVVLELVPPDDATRYTYGGERVKYFEVSCSDFTTMFNKISGLEYTCKGQMFTDILDDAKIRCGGLSVEAHNPDA